MRRPILLLGVVLAVMTVTSPVVADIDTGYGYLERDATSGRYRPIFYEEGSATQIADINSITAPAVSPDGDKVAFSGAVGDESLGRYAIFIANADGSGLRQLTTGNSGELDPYWSPDGDFIVFSLNDTETYNETTCCLVAKVKVSNGAITPLTARIGAIRPEYSPSGNLVVYDTPLGIYTIPANGGKATRRVSAGRDATFSPDGRFIAFVGRSGSNHVISTLRLSDGVITNAYASGNVLESPVWSGERIYFLAHSGFGYDGRTGVSIRSIQSSGGSAVTERSYPGVVVGLSLPVGDAPAFSVGNVNGDGFFDLTVTGPTNRDVLRSTGSSFNHEIWGDLAPNFGWKTHLGGDFNGDGRDDTASYFSTDGTWHVSTSNGSSFSTSEWADFTTATGWTAQLAGDFTGDGRDDIANFHPSNGTWWVSRSTGSTFAPTALWADYTTATGWTTQVVGDYDGDGKDDIANFHPSNGTWWVSRSTGIAFSNPLLWADYVTATGWSAQLVGDFDGDGKDDIANFHPANGTWWVSRSTGIAFSDPVLWADFSTATGWTSQLVGDFDGNGRDDIANYHSSNGSWWVSRSTGSSFTTSRWAS